MRISDIQLFIRIAESRSLRQCAEELFITQQGLSRIIKSLEEELGATLLTRSKSGISLTPKGRLVLSYFENILDVYREMMLKTHINSDDKADVLDFTIYVSPIISEIVISRLIQFLNFRFSNINFILREHSPREMLSDIEYNDHSIGIANLTDFEMEESARLQNGEINFIDCYQEKLMVLLPKGHPLYGKKVFTKDELVKLPIAVINFNRYSDDKLLQKLAPEHTALRPVLHTSSFKSYDSMLLSRGTVGLSSPFKNHFSPTEDTVLVPIEGSYSISYGCLTQVSSPLSEVQSEIIRVFKNITGQIK